MHEGGLAWDLSPYFGCLSFYRSIFQISLYFAYKIVTFRPERSTHCDDGAILNTNIYSSVTETCGQSGEHGSTHAHTDNKSAKSAESTDRTYCMTPVPLSVPDVWSLRHAYVFWKHKMAVPPPHQMQQCYRCDLVSLTR